MLCPMGGWHVHRLLYTVGLKRSLYYTLYR